ncbi:High affinity cGMP-specific 3',5'-cyclic phosphodiesterase 9A [Schistosoma japonicum]|nr:High affinity cGMP-specific 3',5'-cyclic phosphodiesterase 9A [Schistosoma japonicum]
MNATNCGEDITSRHKLINVTLPQNNTTENTTVPAGQPAITPTKSPTILSRKLNTNYNSNNGNNFLTSLYTRCIRNPTRRRKKESNNSHNHHSHFCLDFCGYCSSLKSSSSSSSAPISMTTTNTAINRKSATTTHTESNSFTQQFSSDKQHDNSALNKPNLSGDICSYKNKSATLIPNNINNTLISVPKCTDQPNSICICVDNGRCSTLHSSVHLDKNQIVSKLHHNSSNYIESRNAFTTTVAVTPTATFRSISTMTTIDPADTNTNPTHLIVNDQSTYFNNEETSLEMSGIPVYDSTKLCVKCQEGIQLVSRDSQQILLMKNIQGKHEEIDNINTITDITNMDDRNGHNVDGTNQITNDDKMRRFEEIESDIEEYVKHVQQIFDHINRTKDQFCQTNTTNNHSKQLWDVFSRMDSNYHKILRPSHNDINTFHLDDDDDNVDDVMNNDNQDDDNVTDEDDIEETNYDNVYKCHRFKALSNNKNNEKHIAKMYRQLHNLRCQVESFSYLSWLGMTTEPPTHKVLVPGFDAPAPNPQMHLIRRSDADSRRNIQEFKRLCNQPVSKEDLIELRSSTFNNWSRTDAQLIRLVREMFQELGFIEYFNLQLYRLDLWLSDIYRRYNRIPFHNYKHAFMVTQMCYVLIWGGNLNNLLDIEDQLILIMSAICHDLDHPGFNNAYQINAGTVLAIRYNDQSPLENHHTAVAFDLLSHKEVDPFSHLPITVRQRIRKGMIRCILATDMSRHNEILDEFNRHVLSDLNAAWEIDVNTKKPAWILNKAQKDLVMVIILKISDISNEARPLNVAGPWINRLLAEFFHQSDYEKLVGLPVAPFMDRHKVTKSASQCGFIRFVILPLFESLAKLLPEVKPIIVQPALEQLAYYTELQANEEKKTSNESHKCSNNNNNNNDHRNDKNNKETTDKT